MSTRATYKFPDVCYYIHYDGYPEGAAEYFQAALARDGRGGLQAMFLRANDLAEITVDHDYHADTEYRYTVADSLDSDCGPLSILSALERTGSRSDPEWVLFFEGTVVDFIQKYAPKRRAIGVRAGE